jgi:DNA/RNA-binding domain of Phe-tRNA-synthetase-like protein
MGLKPTQYRCAAEQLLRRLRKEGGLPRIHPLIDACNALSVAFATPVAVLDLAHVAGWLQVRLAEGSERYLSFGGETEHPEPGEVTFVDAEGNAHARRWTHRQSGLSAVRDGTSDVLIVAEALHPTAAAAMPRLLAALESTLHELTFAVESVNLLTSDEPAAIRLSF